MRCWLVLYEIVHWLDDAGLLLYYFLLQQDTEKVSLDRNHHVQLYYSSYTWLLLPFTVLITVHRVYNYCYCYCTVTITVTASFQYSSNMIQIIFELNNNIDGQLILGLEKLMEETASVFWVDLRYRLRSQFTVPLQGSGEWLTSHLFIVLQCYCEYYFTVMLWVLLIITWR